MRPSIAVPEPGARNSYDPRAMIPRERTMQSAETVLAKKAFLRSLIVSVLVSALLGIVAILAGGFGWLELRILLTAVTVSGASLCGLACGAALAAGRPRALPRAGIALAMIAAAIALLGMWIGTADPDFWKFTASVAVFAVACAHVALLSMARLDDSFRWALRAARVAIFGVASLIVLVILFEATGNGVFRLLGVAAIADAALTILVPVLHRLSRAEGAEARSIDAEIESLRARIAELERIRRERAPKLREDPGAG